MTPSLNGYCAAEFERVADAFAYNFRKRRELGAAVCISVEGETVVDLWAGYSNVEKSRAWERDTLSHIFSGTKVATALCAHLLADRGQLDLDVPICSYWPEFGQVGKDEITLKMVLNHNAGIPAIRKTLRMAAQYDWDYMVSKVCSEPPFWQPGTQIGYHVFTFGWIIGEVVRRTTGQTIGQFFSREIAKPLGLDFHIGLPETEHDRLAEVKMHLPRSGDPMFLAFENLLGGQDSIMSWAILKNGLVNPALATDFKSELAAHGGIANARSMMKLMQPLANIFSERAVRLISVERLESIRETVIEADLDLSFRIPMRYSQGFMRRMDNQKKSNRPGDSFIIPENAIGHVGLGGSALFADPDRKLAFGYSMNKTGGGRLINKRGQSLIDETYSALDDLSRR